MKKHPSILASDFIVSLGELTNHRFCKISSKILSKQCKGMRAKILHIKGKRVDVDGQINQKIYKILSWE